MNLSSLSQALESINLRTTEVHPEAMDVEMLDADVSMRDLEVDADSANGHELNQVNHEVPSNKVDTLNKAAPVKEAAVAPSAAKKAETTSDPAKIAVSHESSLAPVPHESLWPSQLGAHMGAHSAMPNEVHHILEVDMPIPAPWHQNLAYTVSTYFYLAFNACVVAIGAWLFQLLLKDVQCRLNSKAEELLEESARCSRDYIANECRSGKLRPALVDYCRDLELCMDRDPHSSGDRINTVATALAEALNAFFTPLSPKSIFLVVASTIAIIYFANFTFGFIRARALYENKPQVSHERLKYKLTPINVNERSGNLLASN